MGSGSLLLKERKGLCLHHHAALTEALGIELRHLRSDSSFRFFFLQVHVAVLGAAICDWMIGQYTGGAADLDQLMCDGKTLRGSIVPTGSGGSTFIGQASL